MTKQQSRRILKRERTCSSYTGRAVNDDWASIGWGFGTNTSKEHEQRGRMIWYSVVRPCGKLELSDLPTLTATTKRRRHGAQITGERGRRVIDKGRNLMNKCDIQSLRGKKFAHVTKFALPLNSVVCSEGLRPSKVVF